MRHNAIIAALVGFGATLGAALADEPAVTVAAATSAAPTKPITASPAPRASAPPHWAYQPVQHHDAPAVHRTAWVRTPIDAFVLAKLEAANLVPSANADRATFIRRASLDVLGTIPSP